MKRRWQMEQDREVLRIQMKSISSHLINSDIDWSDGKNVDRITKAVTRLYDRLYPRDSSFLFGMGILCGIFVHGFIKSISKLNMQH